ncbi:hypothetical protein F4553_007717 [Allocatelliglobosispora scoriae]|uniref:Uncharacterized protein n=1 Tax=Allocatelliglobosispora scoriae TaxID=643052 RepID=A0A841C567_9ACTN|nr:hypothetical protein [Allocatelliglobosispora scoriae]MBB5874283.1 hypothetical protein [Allocatelliglobosispora scoriae]
MSSADDFSLSLAIEDLLPTLLGFVGFLMLGMLRKPRAGITAAVIMFVAGLTRCLWKIIISTGGPDVTWLGSALFPLLMTGAAMLLWSLHGEMPWWPYAAAPVIATGLAIAQGSIQPIFILASVGVMGVSVTGIVLAVRIRAYGSAVLFVIGILAVAGLVPLRSHPDGTTIAFQWIEQTVNTMAQGAFALAAFFTLLAYRSPEASTRPAKAAA